MNIKSVHLAAGGIALLAASHLGPRIAFDKPNEGGGMSYDDLLKAFEKRDQALIEKMAAIDLKTKSNDAALSHIEQRLIRGDGGLGPAEVKSIGSQFIENDRVKAFLEHEPSSGRVDMRVKATLTTATTDAAGSVGAGANPNYRDDLVLLRRRRLRVRNLLPVINVDSGSVEYASQKGRTDGAAMVAEGAAKPQSDIQFELKTTPTRVIAHHIKASKQVLSDFPQLAGLIDTELLDGVALQEEAQLLSGDATGQNLYGMIPQATAYAAPISIADMNYIDAIGMALLQVSLSYYEGDGVIMHPADWLRIRLLKDNEGRYIFGPPNQPVEPRIFGVPVVPTPAMTLNKFLVGQFQVAGKIYDRWDARVETGYVNDDFTRNMVTILGEERLAFAVKEPGALVYGDFDSALSQ